MAIKIYDDKFASCAVIEDRLIPDFFYNDALAYVDEGKVTIRANHKIDRLEFYQIDHTEFIKRNDDPAGATVEEVVQYLNAQFRGEGEAGTPVITNASSSEAISGQLYQFQLTADRSVRYWNESGLPDGLFLNQTNGQVTGVTSQTVDSPYSVSFFAIGLEDVSQQTHTLTVSSVPSFVNSYSTLFRRNQYNYADGGSNSSLYFDETTPFSVSLWFKTGSPFSDGTLYSRTDTSGNGFDLWIDKQGANKYLTCTLRGASGYVEFRGNTNITNNVWRHVVFTYDGTENTNGMEIYVNGAAESKNNTINQTIGTFPTFSQSYLHLGARKATTVLPTKLFNGNIDEVAVSNIELSAANALTIYNSGSPNDLSGLSFYSDIVEWWRMGDNDSIPTFTGQKGVQDLTAVNMTASNIVNDVA